MCFFAHCETELRRPEDDPVAAERQVQAELAAEVQVLQQQHLAQALQTIVDASGMGNGNGAMHPVSQPPGLALELLKQLTNSPAASMAGTRESGSAGNSTNTLMALLQQLGNAQPQSLQGQAQPQPQQQSQPQPQSQTQSQTQAQPQQASQQPSQSSQPIKQQPSTSVEQPPTSKAAQDANVPAGQESLHMALKQVLEQQQGVANPATNGVPQASVAMSYPSTQPPVNMQRGYQFDTSQLLQLDPNILGSLLEQSTAARARATPVSTRHSIDNSFLAAKILGMSGQMESEGAGQGTMMPVQVSQPSAPQSQAIANGMNLPHSQPDVRQIMAANGLQAGHYMNGEVGLQQLNGTVHGIPLDQNSGLSSQFLQLDPALLNSLAMRARQAGPASRMVDNNFLARMSNVDMSGIVNGVVAQPDAAGNPMVAPGVPVQNPSDVQASLLQGVQNGALASQMQALLQGLNLEGIKSEPPQQQQPVQYPAMPTYEKAPHHERVGSNTEGSVLMPSNMLQ